MIETDAFQTLAEFGVAIAGFTSIVVVFGRGGGEFHPADRFRVYTALVPSLLGAFLALVPVGLGMLELGPETVWRVSSLVFAAVVSVHAWASLAGLRKLAPEATQLFHPAVRRGFVVAWFGSIVGSLVNASGLFFAPHGGVYFFVVLTVLALGALSFTRIVFVRPVGASGGDPTEGN